MGHNNESYRAREGLWSLKTSWFYAVLGDAVWPIDFNLLWNASFWGCRVVEIFVREMEAVDYFEWMSGLCREHRATCRQDVRHSIFTTPKSFSLVMEISP
jgi:hypothetical protein